MTQRLRRRDVTALGLAALLAPLAASLTAMGAEPPAAPGSSSPSAEKTPAKPASGFLDGRDAAKWITPEADRAIRRGLEWLAAHQHADGTFGDLQYRYNVAVVSLGGMAMMADGSTPGRGRYGAQVNRCVEYVLKNCDESGLIAATQEASNQPMYGHGFAMLFLAECCGMSQRPELRERLGKAVRLTIDSQKDGGWRYFPRRLDPDTSVTICQVMALRAARNAGVYVPKATIERAIDYVKKSQNADGGFAYMLSMNPSSGFGRSAAAVCGLYTAGVYDAPEIVKGLAYLKQFAPQPGVVRQEPWYFYGHYYAAMAAWQAGGDYWASWYPTIRDDLIARQRPDGSWIDTSVSTTFGTAMGCLILQMPNHCLPIFER